MQLKNTVAELETLINSSTDELFVTDGEGKVLFLTSQARKFYGLDHEDIIGQSVFQLEQAHIFYPSVTALVLRDKQKHTILQTTRHGEHLVVTGTPVFDEQGNVKQVISSALDLKQLPWILSSAPSREIPYSPSRQVKSSVHDDTSLTPIVASTPVMRQFITQIQQAATSHANILLLGETGVGKNLFANYIHKESARAQGPFIEINCATLPESLFESELFGYEHGAFTGSIREGKKGKVELADGGTLFLNEIAEIPLTYQAKLLDFLQTRQFTRVGGIKALHSDIRIICATNRDLKRMVAENLFRADLFYRIYVVPVEIPPLRARIGELEALCLTIIAKLARCYRQPTKQIHSSTLDLLRTYPWPGNVRELENVLERIFISTRDSVIYPEHLPDEFSHYASNSSLGSTPYFPNPKTLHETALHPEQAKEELGLQKQLERLEFEILHDALQRWKTTYAIAQHLQLSQPTVVRKLKKHGLTHLHETP
ncbi:hypothetical protein BM613_13470 [Sulfoacidibacillus thermotolerans]|uniref:Transcriptional regulatory protein TyrR n=1 Tax=Sulfoacidibacillus thermotolerans TaxID=1765684 RepID=A0A2U3D183_SULT2|nr:hypothetical protein BM613_13470 [Sulfoacidibacillus thermotolerans]